MNVRLADPEDARACLGIYRPVIEHSAASFETVVPGATEFSRRIADTLETWPWLVSLLNGEVTGYAYAGQIRERAAYRWSVEVSAYVDRQHRGHGAGRALYGALFDCLRHQRFANAYAGITLPNTASVALHEVMGFKEVGVFRSIGFKFDTWHDVGWWQLRLADPELPEEPIPLSHCRAEIEALLENRPTA